MSDVKYGLRGCLRDALKVEPGMPAVALRRGLTRIRDECGNVRAVAVWPQ